MIPEMYIEQWRKSFRWPTLEQTEQDLIICRVLVDLYKNDYIKNSLIFRGGTALNKLFLKHPARYSEDIDLVQKAPGPIGEILNTIKAILHPMFGDFQWKTTQRSVKIVYKYESVNELPSRLKLEINTTEHFHVLPLKTKRLNVESEWFKGMANISTYEIDELMATKLRALYQRRKGRDLFDLWYVASQNLINLEQVIDVFSKYCKNDNTTITRNKFAKNLKLKKDDRDFQLDMGFLLPQDLDWNYRDAYQFVLDNIINRLP